MELPWNTPLARVLSGVELLHLKCQEWESGASRAVSLTAEMSSLGAVVARWRKLELKSWESLLEMRELAHRTQALKWWFRLYDILINGTAAATGGPQAPATQLSEDDASYRARAVYRLLSLFLRQASVGEYRWRLEILRPFVLHLRMLAATEQSSASDTALRRRLAAVVDNLCDYYAQFLPAITSFAQSRKAVVEKKLKVTYRSLRREVVPCRAAPRCRMR
jgi:midasin (ATPase involved in ribosome maturation)